MPEFDEKEVQTLLCRHSGEARTFLPEGRGGARLGHAEPPGADFQSRSGRTVMLAIDHGYFQGPTTGLERVDLNIVPLLPYANALMLTRGILRSTIPAAFTNGVVLRASGGPSILKELSNEHIAVDVEDAARLNVSAMAVQVFVGGEYETQSIHNMTRLVDAGLRYGIATLGVTAVGKDMVRNAKYFRLACRMCAELGAQVVKDLLRAGRV
jgi:putative autoinducer-2 (AI-2) aldolase